MYDLMHGACVHFQCLLVLPVVESVMPSWSLRLLVFVGRRGDQCTYLNLALWLQAHTRIALQYVYKCKILRTRRILYGISLEFQ